MRRVCILSLCLHKFMSADPAHSLLKTTSGVGGSHNTHPSCKAGELAAAMTAAEMPVGAIERFESASALCNGNPVTRWFIIESCRDVQTIAWRAPMFLLRTVSGSIPMTTS